MDIIKFNLSKPGEAFKPLNATNGGPWHSRHVRDQYRSNFDDYKKARIPFSRNHDSAACSVYGGPFSHDVSRIFPNFNADPDDPASYDFPCTDEAILVCLEAGTETFFRLGQTIEHQIKKHDTLPPADFHKWAVICEHIIRHYNEGWADGFQLDIRYWEIWNEADLDPDDSTNKRTWGGTKEQFFDFYEIVARHLKKCFPELKIGGPAISGGMKWSEDFLARMSEHKVELDFFSWHTYCAEPEQIVLRAERVRNLLDRYGYCDSESILNEWNYVKKWFDGFQESINSIHSIKGAVFTMACISVAQSCPIDMMMYYDTRPSVFNGVFDFYSYQPLKGYYPLYWYGMFYDCVAEIKADSQTDGIYSLCGIDSDGKILSVITCYSDSDDAPNRKIRLDFGRKGSFEIFLLDSEHNGELVATTDIPEITMKNLSAILIREK